MLDKLITDELHLLKKTNLVNVTSTISLNVFTTKVIVTSYLIINIFEHDKFTSFLRHIQS